MANQSAKRIKEQNATIKKSHSIAYFVVILIYSFFRIYLNYETFEKFHTFWFTIINFTTFALYAQLKSGVDLSQEGGLISFYFDVLYISWFVLLGSCFSDSYL